MALGPGQTIQSAYGYQGTPVAQWYPQGNPSPPQQSSQGTVVRTSGRPSAPSTAYPTSQYVVGKGRKNTRKSRKNRKNRRANTMRKGRRNTRK